MNTLSKGLSGIAGEYLTAGELSRRGYAASITLRNNDSVDIHASSASGENVFAVQVKSRQKQSQGWPLSEKAEKLESPNLFYIFVTLRGLTERPDYYIVPSSVVAAQVRESHAKWLSTPGKKGQKHKDTSMRIFEDKMEVYKERWDILPA